jgi:hypothetical protein
MILGAAAVGAAGTGVTAAAGGLSGSVEGQADVQAEQALTVTSVDAIDDDSEGDQDASFTRVSDDNTEFQAAVELNNGDFVGFQVTVENSAADPLDVQIAIDAPDPFDIEVQQGDRARGLEDTTGLFSEDELDPDDDGDSSDAVQTGEGTFITTIGDGNNNNTDEIGIYAELEDTASPGSYDIGAAINPLSTN